MKKLSILLALFTASMFSLFFLSATAMAGEGPMKLPEKAKADAISAASDRGDDDAPKNTSSLNSSEKQLAGSWEYIGI